MGELSIKQRYWVVKRRLCGTKVFFGFEKKLNINGDMFYYHWNNFQRFGWDGLKSKSRAPHTVHRTPQKVVEKVIEIRKNRGWCPNKIEKYLHSKNIKLGHGLDEI